MVTRSPRGSLLLATTAAASAVLLAGCGPARDCTERIYHLSDDPRIERVEIVGDLTGWEPLELDLVQPGAWHAAFTPPPGDHLYELRVDGRRELDVLNGLTGWRDGVEYSLLRVDDCEAPGWRVDRADATPDGAFEVELTFLRGAGGPSLDGGSVVATLADGTPLPGVVGQAGRVTVAGAGLPRGKHTVVVRASDRAGTGAGELLLPLWVEPEPFDWGGALIYQVVLDRFADAGGALPSPPGPGLRAGGDLPGLLGVLEAGYFDELGVTALWLSPVARNAEGTWPGSDGHEYDAYHGYWPAAPREVEPALGTVDDLDAVVAEAHARGIRIVLDVVPNHVHTDHPWYADWPSGRWNGDGDCVCGAPGCSWGENIETCWFTPYLADLDWTDPEVVTAVTDELAWWVERFDLDGVRIDAVPMMPRSATREIAWTLRRRFERGSTGLYLLGETYGGPESWGSIQRFLGPFGLDGQFDFPVMWAVRETLGHGDGSLRDLAATIEESAATWEGPDAVMAPLVGNHDVRRFVSEAAGDGGDAWTSPPPPPDDDAPYRRLVMAQAVVLSLPGAPVLYYGDELGLPGGRDPDNRRPMRFGGDLSEREAWTRDRVSAVGRARACLPALRAGELSILEVEDDVLALLRDAGDGEPALVIVNRSAEPLTRSYPLPESIASSGTTLVDALDGGEAPVQWGAAGPIELAPLSAQVLIPRGACD